MLSAREGLDKLHIAAISWLAVAQLAIYLFGSLPQSVGTITQQLLQEVTTNHSREMIMRHSNRVDLSLFEDPDFYDALQQAQREMSFRPVTIINSLFNLLRSIITFVSMITFITSLGWFVTSAALVTSFIASQRYSTVRLTDPILVLEHVRRTGFGSPEELLALSGIYAELFNSQAIAFR